jgi:hypothetical protein
MKWRLSLIIFNERMVKYAGVPYWYIYWNFQLSTHHVGVLVL